MFCRFAHSSSTVVAVSLLLSFALYLPSLPLGFIHDDHSQIENNQQIQSWNYAGKLLTTQVWSQRVGDPGHFYRPLFSLWLLVVYSIGGLSPWVWHLSNILLNALAIWVVFTFCRGVVSTKASAVAALLFAVQPIHVDAVSWISASDELLFTIFGLLSVFFLIKSSEAPNSANGVRILSVLFYSAALFTKETAVAILPIVLLITLLWNDDQPSDVLALVRPSVRVLASYVLATLFYLWARWTALRGFGVGTGRHSWRQVLFTFPSVFLFYCKKLVWPKGLSFFYWNPLLSGFATSFWLGFAVLMLVAAVTTWFAYQRSKAVALGLALVLLPLFPPLSTLRIYGQGNMTHDRYLYLPSVGLCLLIGLASEGLVARWPKTRIPVIGALVALCSLYTYLAVAQQRFYRDDETSLLRGLEIAPQNVLLMDSLGKIYLKRGDPDAALSWLRRAQKTAPDDPNTTLQLARGLTQTGHYDEAEVILLELSQNSGVQDRQRSMAFLYLANVHIETGKLERAEQDLNKLAQADPAYPGLHRTLGIVFQKEQRILQAQAEYAREFQITGDAEAGRQAGQLMRIVRSNPSLSQ